MKNNFKFLSVALTVIVALASMAFGQRTTGNVEGTITDTNGAVVPGVTVTIKSTGATTGYSATTTTNADGYFTFQQISAGTYVVTTSKSGFKGAKSDVTVVLDKTTPVNARLEVGDQNVTVDIVSDGSTDIDLSDTKIDTNISKQVFDALPRGVQFGSLLKTAPNVRPEALAGGFQVDGASGSENTFIIDGQEVTNFRDGTLNPNNNLPFELLQEVQIKSTGYEAEYGGATGGVVNVVTAGGNNQWRGNFGVSFTPQGLQGAPREIINRFSTVGRVELFQPKKDAGIGTFPVASFSGPIVKDKMWFSGVYAPQNISRTRKIDYFNSPNPITRQLVESRTFSQNVMQEYVFGRIDVQPTSRLSGFASFVWNPTIQDGVLPGFADGLSGPPVPVPFGGTIGTLIGEDLARRQGGRQNSNTVNGQLTWRATDNLIINGRAGRTFLNEKLDSYFLPNITRYQCSTNNAGIPVGAGCAAGFQNITNNAQIAFDVSTRTTFDVDAAVLNVNAAGRHSLKFGYQFNRLFNTVNRGYVGLGIITLFYGVGIDQIGAPGITPTAGNIGSGRLQRFGTIGEASSNNQALFVQDTWNVTNRLTLNLGVRIENETVPNFGAANNTQAIEFGWGDKISPRIGAAFDLTGDGKTKLFANYGWFYDRFKYELPRGSFGGDFFRRDFFELFPARGVAFNSYTLGNVLGTFNDPIGGQCPITAPTGFSRCQLDFRIATNITGADIFESGAVDPNLQAARQSEYTIGLERQLGKQFLIAARYTHKQVDRAIEDVGVLNQQGSEAYIIANPGIGLACQVSTQAGYPCAKAERRFDAIEVRLDKRASNYFFNVNYTWSRLFGNYSGLASSDENGRNSPGVNRFFDLPPLGFNANGQPDNGLLATDRPHVVKAFAGYTFDWFGRKNNQTTISGFTTLQSGTPLTTIYDLYQLGTTILFRRGDLGRTAVFTETDLSISHRYTFGRDGRFKFEPFVNFLNLFDERNELGRQNSISSVVFLGGGANANLVLGGCTACTGEVEVFNQIFRGGGIQRAVVNYLDQRGIQATGKRNDYNLSNRFQAPREVRFGFRVFF